LRLFTAEGTAGHNGKPMASLYYRGDVLWVKWRNPDTGCVERVSTGCRRGLDADRRRALEIRNQKEALELRGRLDHAGMAWSAWVPQFIADRYAESPGTRDRLQGIWKTLALWLEHIDVRTPRQLRREHCLGYIRWRREAGHMNAHDGRGQPVAHNTALLEIKILNIILTEAVHRRFIEWSPAWKLGIKKLPARQKGILTPRHIAVIRAEIAALHAAAVTAEDKSLAEYFDHSFEIALAQGCRLAETWIPLSRVNLRTRTVLLQVKGGTFDERSLNPALVPLFERLLAAGRTHSYERPRMASFLWFKFFDRLRAKDASFHNISHHSCRGTVKSYLEQHWVAESVAMKLTGSRDVGVHRTNYRKYERPEFDAAWRSLQPLIEAAGTVDS
jgi:hypothetical protein